MGALKLKSEDHNLVQAPKGHSSTSQHSVASSEGNPLISKPILHSTSKPSTISNHPQQQKQQTLPARKKMSEQSVEDYQLDSFDDTDSESDNEYEPIPEVINSTPSVMDKKLPGLSVSFDKAPFKVQSAVSEEKEKETHTSNDKTSATQITSDKPATTMVDVPATKETENLGTEKVENFSVKKEDASSNFDSSSLVSVAEDDNFKQFGSDSEEEEEEDDLLATGYVPSVSDGLTKQSRKNPTMGDPQQITTAEKEKDKILELAQSSFLEMEGTSHKSDSHKSDTDKTGKNKDTVDTGSSLSHNLGTFSPITPLTDQPNTLSTLPSDAKLTNKKTLGSSATTGHATGVMSQSSGSDSSLNTDSVIRQAEEIERINPTSAQEVQDNADFKLATTIKQEKSDKQQSEGNDNKYTRVPVSTFNSFRLGQ